MVVKAPFPKLLLTPKTKPLAPHFQPFYPEIPELEELTRGPVPATAARKEAKGKILSPCFNLHLIPIYSSLTPSPIYIPWSHQHPRLPGTPTGMIQGGL